MSRPSNSERYIIALNFKYARTSELVKKIDIVEKILDDITRTDDLFTNDIFTSFSIPSNLEITIRCINTDILNMQHSGINKIMQYINGKNYFGDNYHNYRDKQIRSSSYWTKTFFPITKKDVKLSLQTLKQKVISIITKNDVYVHDELAKLDKLFEDY